jgi:hypothetical protein
LESCACASLGGFWEGGEGVEGLLILTFKIKLQRVGGVLLACENVAMVVSGRDESRPCCAKMSRKMISFPRRVATDFLGWNELLAIPKGMFAIEKCFAYMANVL